MAFPNEPERTDPALTWRVRQVLEERRELIRELEPLIAQMEQVVRELPYEHVTDDTGIRLDHRLTGLVHDMRREYADWKWRERQPITDTYVGNCAVGYLGKEITKREMT